MRSLSSFFVGCVSGIIVGQIIFPAFKIGTDYGIVGARSFCDERLLDEGITRCNCDGSLNVQPANHTPLQVVLPASIAKGEQHLLPANPSKQPDKLTFTEILKESGSDKYYRHHFEQYYEKWLEPFRSKFDLTMLELGARDGRSMQLWDKYFEHPKVILGLAYGSYSENVERTTQILTHVQIFRGDQSEPNTMAHLRDKGPWDIIIDDASHVPQHQVYSLFHLWQSVKPGGIYVIEDLETNYWRDGTRIYDYTLKSTGIGAAPNASAVSKLEQIQQVLMRHQIGARNLTVMPGDDRICSMEWGMNLVVLRKCELNIELPPYQEPQYDQSRMQSWIRNAKSTNPSLDMQ